MELPGDSAIAKTVAVACVDQTEIVSPIFHGDAVRFEGEVINTGSSSLTVQMTGYRHDISTRQFVHAVNAVITLVALDEQLRPSRGLPPLVDRESPERVERLKTLAKQRKELSARWQSAQEAVDLLPRVTMEMLDSVTTGLETSVAVPVKDTLVALNTSFMPRYLNRHGTVFGGDILLWMVRSRAICWNSRPFTNADRFGMH
ncbi:hypothetical protein BBJ28_00002056 [Nothophytophthora sp. Chile5]|nr:hypothetical protein BBJ28_00002056 [Nothophytophthora sp. Chile5]